MSGVWWVASLIKLEILKYQLEINLLVFSAVSACVLGFALSIPYALLPDFKLCLKSHLCESVSICG